MKNEIWKDIENYEGLYQISNKGNVRSLNRYVLNCHGKQKLIKGKVLKLEDVHGYLRAELSKDGKRRMFRVHRLVAKAFIPNPHNLPEVNHKDENKKNDHEENLEWCTCQQNQNHGTHNERSAKSKGHSVQALDKNGNVIMEFWSISEASRRTGLRIDCISGCINGRYKTSGGYIWRRKVEV